MTRNNHKISEIFHTMAEVLQILDANHFKVIAFQKASRVMRELPRDVAEIEPSELKKIDGIGKGTAKRIAEFLKTERIIDNEKLLEQVPVGLLSLLDIPGMGAKTVSLLWTQAAVVDLDSLKSRLATGELELLPGLGAKKLENIQKNIAFAESARKRTNLGVALPLARSIIDTLSQAPGVKKIDHAGSLRRGCETIGDIDLLVAASQKDASSIMKLFVGLDLVDSVIVQGTTKSSIRTSNGLQIDLRLVPMESYGAAMMYFTGSKEHNVRLRERAQSMNMTLNEYRLEHKKTKQVAANHTEQQIYKALQLDWIPPELREDRGEITAAESGVLPRLIQIQDIRAELHAHTTASDGLWSITKLAQACIERGFHTVAVTDHSKGQIQANGLNHRQLSKHIKQVRKIADELKSSITILAGSEVDILADGKLDYPNNLLAELDIVIASPHAGLSQSPEKATCRLLRAIENPYVTILGHPTGRLIGRREGLRPDIGTLIEAAQQRGIAMEINANSWRLDLRDLHAHAAIDAKVKLAINTDAHGPGDLDQLQFGVLTARRAGTSAKNVINCMTKATLDKWLQSTRD